VKPLFVRTTLATLCVLVGVEWPLASCATSVGGGDEVESDAASPKDSSSSQTLDDAGQADTSSLASDSSIASDALTDTNAPQQGDAASPDDSPAPTDAPVDSTDAADAADAAITVPTVGLVGEWLCSGNTNDTSGEGNNGTPTSVSFISDRHGVVASACGFNGTTSFIGIPNATSLNVTTTWSLSAWVLPSGFSALAGIASKYHSVNADGLTVRLSYSSPFTGIDVDEATNVPDAAIGLLTLGTWSHVGVTVNGTAVQCYIDGVLAYSGTGGYQATTNTDPLDIGLDYTNRYFDGAIDDVRLYDRVLSASEIEALYLAP
jgi:hypothetical protein